MTNTQRIMKILSKNGFYYFVYYFLKFTKIANILSDKFYVSLQYRCYTGKRLNLITPITYNEKLCWLKLYDHDERYVTFVDKYKVKDYVASKIGNEYIIKTLAVWNTPNEIDITSLPEKFVLKTNHSGNNEGVVICKDKSTFDLNSAIQKLRKSFESDFYIAGREWPYKNVKRVVFAEEYKEDSKYKELRDYKFFCFDGKVKALFVALNRQTKEGVEFAYFDEEYNHLGIHDVHGVATDLPEKPSTFEEMKNIASKLSEGIVQSRIDLYEVDGKIYFGEITLYHNNGTALLNPDKWNKIFGDWIDLSLVKK